MGSHITASTISGMWPPRVAMSVGVPNTYNQRRMGHKTDNMLKNVYLHTMRSKEDHYADMIDDAYDKILRTDLRTEKTDA